jgi:hypothetical protein
MNTDFINKLQNINQLYLKKGFPILILILMNINFIIKINFNCMS